MCIISLVADVNEPGCGGAVPPSLTNIMMEASLHLVTRHLGGGRCRGGRGEHSFSSVVTSQHQSPVIGQKYDVIITSSRGPPSLSAVIRAEVNRSVNTLSAAVTPSY